MSNKTGPLQALRDALEQIAQHSSSDWPERCRENVRCARAALAAYEQRAAAPERDERAAQAVEPQWRCFHCGDVFHDKQAAELHFGKSEHDRPFCQIDVTHFRWMEAQHRRNCDDDSEALRTVRSLVGEHERLRRQAEEEGYTRGLADARKHPEELGLAAASPEHSAEPVARLYVSGDDWQYHKHNAHQDLPDGEYALYTAPPKDQP